MLAVDGLCDYFTVNDTSKNCIHLKYQKYDNLVLYSFNKFSMFIQIVVTVNALC